MQVRRGDKGPEYVFRSAIQFNEIPAEQEKSLNEFLQIQMDRLQLKQKEVAAAVEADAQE